MPIIPEVGRKSFKMRLLVGVMYAILMVFGVTMVYPFLITLSSSVSNRMDYQRFSPISRALYSRDDRFVRGLVEYYPADMRNGMTQFAVDFANVPSTWTAWATAGKENQQIDKFAEQYLQQTRNSKRWASIQQAAADYAVFASHYPINDSICAFDSRNMAPYFRERYTAEARKHPSGDLSVDQRALDLVGQHWGVPFESFYTIKPSRELQMTWDLPSYRLPSDGRAQDFARLREAYRDREFLPGAMKAKWYTLLQSADARSILGLKGKGELSLQEFNDALGTQYEKFKAVPFPVTAQDPSALQSLWEHYIGYIVPVCETRPYPMKAVWLSYLGSGDGREAIGLSDGGTISIDEYNKAFGTSYATLRDTPFPIPAQAPTKLHTAWEGFVQKQYPRRLIDVQVTSAIQAQYLSFVRGRFQQNLTLMNKTIGTKYNDWSQINFASSMPTDNEAQAQLWMEFVGKLPYATKIPHSAEAAYQQYLLEKYKSLDGVNKAYGCHLQQIEQAQLPFDLAYLVTFVKNERPLQIASFLGNYEFVFDYLVLRGHALGNTFILIALTILAALTVNPLAAYALSRFRMRQTPAIILFLLATMAFPAAVSMIPGYLLMRDMHLLNTYAALILPHVANGMGIFLLKGFFDGLPPELYEAAALDGAKEWQTFLKITLPLSKPILAVNALHAFIGAYSGWEWALVVCQKQEMWTISVWLYQFTQTMSTMPGAVMASFVLASLPVFLVFLFCQNIILRGIVLPQMK